MIKRLIIQYYNEGIYSDEDIDVFVASGYLTVEEANTMKEKSSQK